jgi:hypothetical protein
MPARPAATMLTIAHTGDTWSYEYPAYRSDYGCSYGASSLQGYGDDWRNHADSAAADCVVIDWSTATADQATHAAISGPMHSPSTPAGMIGRLWAEPQPIEEEHEFFGAGPLDTLNTADYARMITRHGITVRTIADQLSSRAATIEEITQP